MSSLSHRYRDFGAPEPETPSAPTLPEAAVEDLQLESFESGYQAGWDDAIKAHENSAGTAAADIAQNLQDMSFTHREAYLKLSAAMKPLLSQIVNKLLPPVAQRIIGAHILSELDELMEAHANTVIEIVVCPENLDDLQALLNEMARTPFVLRADAVLTTGQAYVRVNETEREINLTAVLSGVSEALDAYFEQTKEERADG